MENIIINQIVKIDLENNVVIYRSSDREKDYIDRRGIHVVVGHYIGDSVDPLKSPNITKGTIFPILYA